MQRRPLIHMRALVIDHRVRLKEKDVIVRLLCEDGCLRSAVAKGALRPGGRFASRTELGCEADFLLSEGTSLDTIQEAQLRNANVHIREDPDTFALACAACELTRYLSSHDARDAYVFAICTAFLAAIKSAKSRNSALAFMCAYALKLMAHAGYLPILASCASCSDEQVAYFSVLDGGALCASCARGQDMLKPYDTATRTLTQQLLNARFADIAHMTPEGEPAYAAASLMCLWAQTYLDVRLHAFEFLLH